MDTLDLSRKRSLARKHSNAKETDPVAGAALSPAPQGIAQRVNSPSLSSTDMLYLQRTVGNQALLQLLRQPDPRPAPAPVAASAPLIQREEDEGQKTKQESGGSNRAQNAVAPTKNIYLLGHGIHDFVNGFFTLPENTTVSFYTLPGRAMNNPDALRILRGEHTGASERLIAGGESCPNMTLQPEDTEEAKIQNKKHAEVATANGHDMVQVDSDESLQDIIKRRGPGYNYIWACCSLYEMSGKRFSEALTPMGSFKFGNMHSIDEKRKDHFAYWDRSGPAGGWYQHKSHRSSHSDIAGTIEDAELQSSGKMVALQVLLPSATSKIEKRRELETTKFKSYTVFIRNEVLASKADPAGQSQEDTSSNVKAFLPTLTGKNIKIHTAKVLDKSARLLVVEKPEAFSIGPS